MRDDVHRNSPVTNEQLESELNSRSCKHGGPLLEVAVGLISHWKMTQPDCTKMAISQLLLRVAS